MSQENLSFPEIDFTEDVLPRIPLDEVLALQALTMGRVRKLARTQVSKRDPHTSGFVLLHTTAITADEGLIQLPNEYGEYENDIQVDTYMSAIVRKSKPQSSIDVQSWQFTLSFLRNELTEYARFSNERTRFTFSWQRNSTEALGVRRRRVLGSLGGSSTESMTDGNILQIDHEVDPIRVEVIEPLVLDDLRLLRSAVDRYTAYYVADSARALAYKRAA